MDITENTLADFSVTCKEQAKELGDWKSISVDDLVEGYISATEQKKEYLRNAYLSAILLNEWSMIRRLYEATKSVGLYSLEDFITIVYERIEYACKYKAWRDPAKKVNAEQCIKQAISTEVRNIFYRSNLDIHKANVNTVSTEQRMEDFDNNDALEMEMMGEDESDKYSKSTFAAKSYIQSFVNSNKIVEAIILDTIAFNDTIKTKTETKKAVNTEGKEYYYKDTTTSFWRIKAVNHLSSLPENYNKYFSSKYTVDTEVLESAVAAIKKASNQKLYKYLDKTLEYAKSSAAVLYKK